MYGTSTKKKQEAKMIKVQEDNYRECHRQLSASKGQITLGSGAVMMLSMYLVNNYFYGVVIGKLPFEPHSMVTNMTHRGLEGDDMSQVSVVFIYIMLQMALRGNISKITGSDGPRMPIEFQTP